MKLVYLASPYSSDDPIVQMWRHEAVCRAYAKLMNRWDNTYVFFCPIAMSHNVARYLEDGSWEGWKKVDEEMLSRCDELWVLPIDGHKESVGITAERAWWHKNKSSEILTLWGLAHELEEEFSLPEYVEQYEWDRIQCEDFAQWEKENELSGLGLASAEPKEESILKLNEVVDKLICEDKALRYNSGKPQLSYNLLGKEAIEGECRVWEYGGKKYSRGNWLKGTKWTEAADSLLRHLTSFLNGVDIDEESQQNHVDHVVCCAKILSNSYYTRKDLDDRS
jgi:hypothetical protein